MDVKMSALPSGSSIGCYLMEKHPVGPQVTLNLSVHPPVLDTTGIEPVTSKSSSFCGSSRRFGGHLLRSFLNLVNPGLTQPFQPPPQPPPPMQQNFIYPEATYPMLEGSSSTCVNPLLWYQPTPGANMDYPDPLQAFYQCSNMVLPGYPGEAVFGTKTGMQKSSKPLNPEAKEWVPSNFNKEQKSSVPSCSVGSSESIQNPLIISSHEFIEISDKEIKDVRNEKNSQNATQNKMYICNNEKNVENLKPTEKLSDPCKNEKNFENTKHVEVFPNVSRAVNGICGILGKFDRNFEKSCSSISKLDNALDAQEKGNDECVNFADSKTNDSLSYASIIRKSPEPPLKSSFENAPEKNNALSHESIKQPLPKIFLKDKKYPKEKAAPLMEGKKRDPLPFRTASKTQKKNSRKFLKDLRDLSPAKSESSYSESEVSLDSSSDLMSRLCVSVYNSPSSSSSLSCASPNDKIIPSCIISPKNSKPHGSLSASSEGTFKRTVSESSGGSVESVDIEFAHCDESELFENVSSKGKCKSPHPNHILSHILGFDSDSDDSDDESDSDWDDNECESVLLDDSWETFGLTIPLITKSLPPSSKSCDSNVGNDLDHSENICDTTDNTYNLVEINRRWEEEIRKDVSVASPCRVSFGEARVHTMITWSYAYKNARIGPWEQYARDRARFSNRISSLESVLTPVLENSHRQAMYSRIYGC